MADIKTGTISTEEAKVAGLKEGSYVTSEGVYQVKKTQYGVEVLRTSSVGQTGSPTVYVEPSAAAELPLEHAEVAREVRSQAIEFQKEAPSADIEIKKSKGGLVLTAEMRPSAEDAIARQEPSSRIVAGEVMPSADVSDVVLAAQAAPDIARQYEKEGYYPATGKVTTTTIPGGVSVAVEPKSVADYQKFEKLVGIQIAQETPLEKAQAHLLTAIGTPYGLQYLASYYPGGKTPEEIVKQARIEANIAREQKKQFKWVMGSLGGTVPGVLGTAVATTAGLGAVGAGAAAIPGTAGVVARGAVAVGGVGLGGLYVYEKGKAIIPAVKEKEYEKLGEEIIRTGAELGGAVWGIKSGERIVKSLTKPKVVQSVETARAYVPEEMKVGEAGIIEADIASQAKSIKVKSEALGESMLQSLKEGGEGGIGEEARHITRIVAKHEVSTPKEFLSRIAGEKVSKVETIKQESVAGSIAEKYMNLDYGEAGQFPSYRVFGVGKEKVGTKTAMKGLIETEAKREVPMLTKMGRSIKQWLLKEADVSVVEKGEPGVKVGRMEIMEMERVPKMESYYDVGKVKTMPSGVVAASKTTTDVVASAAKGIAEKAMLDSMKINKGVALGGAYAPSQPKTVTKEFKIAETKIIPSEKAMMVSPYPKVSVKSVVAKPEQIVKDMEKISVQAATAPPQVVTKKQEAAFSQIGQLYSPEQLEAKVRPKKKKVVRLMPSEVEMSPLQERMTRESTVVVRKPEYEWSSYAGRVSKLQPKRLSAQMTSQLSKQTEDIEEQTKTLSAQLLGEEEMAKPVLSLAPRTIFTTEQEQVVSPRMAQIQTQDLGRMMETGQRQRVVPRYEVPFDFSFKPPTKTGWLPSLKPRRTVREKRREPTYGKLARGFGFTSLKRQPFKPVDWGLPPTIGGRWVTKVPRKKKARKKKR